MLHANLNRSQIKTRWASNTDPFHYVVIDDFLENELALRVAAEMKDYIAAKKDSFVQYDQKWEKRKFTQNKLELMPEQVSKLIRYFNSSDFLRFLEEVTGFGGLAADEGLWGGGIHSTFAGGKLDIHNDFSILPTTYGQEFELHRVLNLIVYMNPGWQPAWRGELELWDAEMKAVQASVSPRFNRAVVFYTYGSNHGQPDPYLGPEDEARLSLATYYYQKVAPGSIPHRSTLYQIRPGERETEEEKRLRMERASEERYSKLKK